MYVSCDPLKELDEFTLLAQIKSIPSSRVRRDGSVGIATCYGLDGPGIESRWEGGARFSTPVQTGRGAHLAPCTVDTGPFPGGKAAGARRRSPPPSSSAVVKERVELYISYPSGPSWPVLG